MGNFELQKRLIVAGLGLLFVVDGALAYYGSKLANARQSPTAVLTAESRQIGLLKEDIKRASGIKEKIPQYVAWFDEIEGTLPVSTDGYSVLLQEMGDYARTTHVSIEDTRFRQKDVPGRSLVEVEIDSTVNGDYGGIVRYLNALQRSKNVYIVDTLGVDSITAVQGQVPGSLLRVNLHLRTYFRKA